jgi:hypothetical protein
MLAAFLWAVHALSLLAAWLNPLPAWLRLALSLCVLLSLRRALRRNREGTGITGLRLKPDGSWTVRAGDAEVEASLLGSSLATPWFVLLHWRAETGRLSLLACRDSLDPDAFRRLRVALKVIGKPGGEDPVNP